MNTHNTDHKFRITALLSLFLCFVLICPIVVGCAPTQNKGDRPTIVVTTFVLYDWVRQVLGDEAENYSVVLLGADGADIHSYQPTVKDISALSAADMFIFIGGESDSFVEDMINSANAPQLYTLNLAKKLSHFFEDADESHEHEHEHEHGDPLIEDEHIWFSFEMTRAAVFEISDALSELYPEHSSDFGRNAYLYSQEIADLEREYTLALTNGQKYAVVCDRYPFSYLFDSLGIECYAAFDGCFAETEASFETVKKLSQKIDALSLEYVLVCENSSTAIAEAVISNTEKKNADILVLDSMQSVNDSRISKGETYLSIMKKNLDVLKRALG